MSNADLYIFRQYSVERLASRTGYNFETLLKLKRGNRPITQQFRKRMAAALRQREDVLFAPVGAAA